MYRSIAVSISTGYELAESDEFDCVDGSVYIINRHSLTKALFVEKSDAIACYTKLIDRALGL